MENNNIVTKQDIINALDEVNSSDRYTPFCSWYKGSHKASRSRLVRLLKAYWRQCRNSYIREEMDAAEVAKKYAQSVIDKNRLDIDLRTALY